MRPFLVATTGGSIELALLLECIHAGRAGSMPLQGVVHALMATDLLRAAGPDALDDDAEPEHGRGRNAVGHASDYDRHSHRQTTPKMS